SLPQACIKISNPIGSRPMTCFNAVIRACLWSRGVSPWKRAGRPWRTVSFQLASKDGLSRCSRHSSADERCPESSCRTTWALNPAVKLRRVRRGISYSFRGQYFLSYRSHRRGAAQPFRDLAAHLLQEVLADAVVGEVVTQRPQGRAKGGAEELHEEEL